MRLLHKAGSCTLFPYRTNSRPSAHLVAAIDTVSTHPPSRFRRFPRTVAQTLTRRGHVSALYVSLSTAVTPGVRTYDHARYSSSAAGWPNRAFGTAIRRTR